jgi:hypothetical protein
MADSVAATSVLKAAHLDATTHNMPAIARAKGAAVQHNV